MPILTCYPSSSGRRRDFTCSWTNSSLVSFSVIVLLVLRQFSFVDLRTYRVEVGNTHDIIITASAPPPSPQSGDNSSSTTPLQPSKPVLRPPKTAGGNISSSSSSSFSSAHGRSAGPLLRPTGRGSGGGFGFQKRYADTPFRTGYKAGGGPLPREDGDFLYSPRMWKYVDNHTCLIHNKSDGGKDGDDDDDDDDHAALDRWQRRAPYAILLGAMKCGTHALTEALWEHPLVARNGHWELHFFDGDRPFRTEMGIDHWKSRTAYAAAFRKASPEFFQRLVAEEEDDDHHDHNNDTNGSGDAATADGMPLRPDDDDQGGMRRVIAMESSPRYMLNSDRLPHLIVCVVPWVKFLVLLRDPVARAESQYRFLDESRRENGKPMVDWTAWIDDDVRLLAEAGFWNATSREEEKLAWKVYQRRPNSNMIVGRGLYVVQLLDYLDAMDATTKPRSDMLVLQSEKFRGERQGEYDRVLTFLGLPPHSLLNSTGEVHATQNKGVSTPMPESVRRRLQLLYRPYNDRLYDLLGWEKVWD